MNINTLPVSDKFAQIVGKFDELKHSEYRHTDP